MTVYLDRRQTPEGAGPELDAGAPISSSTAAGSIKDTKSY